MKRDRKRRRGKHSLKTQRTRTRESLYRETMERKTISKRKLNKKKVIIVLVIFVSIIALIVKLTKKDKTVETSIDENTSIANVSIDTNNNVTNQNQGRAQEKTKKELNDWRITLANFENILPEDFTVKVANIDENRQFDARAVDELKDMMNDMKKAGINNIWVQSAYRSMEKQKELYDNSVKKYLKQGKTQEEAERLTDEYINKPGSSDHNLGLAIDFNYVDNKFEDLKGFKWLKENAEDYGFVLRYPKDKEDITKISYESWHWRYVGKEHAKEMNELNMCLEEYVEYLQEQ